MFNKKIILFLSLLLVTGSSYFIFHRKKNDDDEVNIVDNSDNSINNDLNEEESVNENTGSSSSFLKYLIFFIIVIIVAIIIFFAVKKIINKKKNNITNKNTEENKKKGKSKNQLPELKEDKKYSENFNKYIRNRNEILKKTKINKESIETLANNIIKKMQENYEEYMNQNNINPEDYDEDNYLVDFYFGVDARDDNYNIKITEENQKVFIKDGKRVRDVNKFQTREIIVNLFVSFFGEIEIDKRFFDGKVFFNTEEENENLINIFIVTVIEPFFYYVSENKKNVRFISEHTNILHIDDEHSLLNDIFDKTFCWVVKIFSLLKQKTTSWPERLMINELINFYFPESKELKEKEVK